MTEPIAGDLLEGAVAIASFLYGADKARAKRRRVYFLAERGLLPVFHVGEVLCARRSTLAKWIEQQEKAGGASD